MRFSLLLFAAVATLAGCHDAAPSPDPSAVQAAFGSCMGEEVDAGIAALDAALAAHPGWPDALAARGLCRWTRFAADSSRADLEAAHADLTAAIEGLADWADAAPAFSPDRLYSHRAFVRRALDTTTWGPALADLDQAVQLAPRDLTHRFDRGLARSLSGDADGAREDLTAFLQQSDSTDAGRRARAREVLGLVDV